MGRLVVDQLVSRWHTMLGGLTTSTKGFYEQLESTLKGQQVQGLSVERVDFREGGVFSAKREYLQVRRHEHVFHVCAAPFGTGFFISWWLGEVERGFMAWLARKPVIGFFVRNFIKPLTYYRIDTALMFQSVTHGAVLAVIDGMTSEKGLRTLAEHERAPVMRDFFTR